MTILLNLACILLLSLQSLQIRNQHRPSLPTLLRPPEKTPLCRALHGTTKNSPSDNTPPLRPPISLINELIEETRGASPTPSSPEQLLVETPVMFSKESPDQSFDLDRWDVHRSSTRYARLLPGMFSGVTTKRILPTISSLVVWSAAVDFYNSVEASFGLPEVVLPLTPFDLTAPVLGLLLVFRSNTSYERFDSGSEKTWEITSTIKSIAMQIMALTAAKRFGEEERQSAYDLVRGVVLVHSWLMRRYLKGSSDMSVYQKDIFFRLVLAEDYCRDEIMEPSSVTKTVTPSLLLTAISLGITRRLPSLDFQESTFIQDKISFLRELLKMTPEVLNVRDPKTKLYPFMLAAVHHNNGLNVVFELLSWNPTLVHSNRA